MTARKDNFSFNCLFLNFSSEQINSMLLIGLDDKHVHLSINISPVKLNNLSATALIAVIVLTLLDTIDNKEKSRRILLLHQVFIGSRSVR